jgi:hypothetical protein
MDLVALNHALGSKVVFEAEGHNHVRECVMWGNKEVF